MLGYKGDFWIISPVPGILADHNSCSLDTDWGAETGSVVAAAKQRGAQTGNQMWRTGKQVPTLAKTLYECAELLLWNAFPESILKGWFEDTNHHFLPMNITGFEESTVAGETVQWLRAFVALPEELGLVPSTHSVTGFLMVFSYVLSLGWSTSNPNILIPDPKYYF